MATDTKKRHDWSQARVSLIDFSSSSVGGNCKIVCPMPSGNAGEYALATVWADTLDEARAVAERIIAAINPPAPPPSQSGESEARRGN